MKKIIILSILLAGCATANVHPVDSERAAWARAEAKASEECLGGKTGDAVFDAVNKENVRSIHSCMRNISDKEIRPKVAYLDLYTEQRARGDKIFSEFESGKISKKNFQQRLKDNYQGYEQSVMGRAIQLSSSADLCVSASNSPTDAIMAEVKRRGVDCYAEIALAQQRQMIAAQQQANQQAFGASLMNYGAQMQSLSLQQQAIQNANRPINTNCYRTHIGMNCTSY